MTIIGEYCDKAISGKTDNRPSFQRLIKDSEKGQFEAVIMYTLDRFARNRYDSAIYKAKLKKNGVRVYYAKQPMPDTPEGIILESVLEGYAEYYSENLSRNIKRGMKENALQCIANGGAGMPLGYTVGEDRRYKIDPVGARIVQEIFQMYADGMSATQIINECNKRGYKTARGNAFNKNSLRTMLKNDRYIGVYRFADVVVEGGVPPIISRELFDKVQATLKHNYSARARNKAKDDYLLTAKLFCGHCGSSMVGESGTSKSGKLHHYYKCIERKRKHKCNKAVEKKDWMEELVVRFTVQKVLTDENIERIAVKAMEIIEKESADTTYIDGLRNELKEVKKKIKNLMTAIEQGIITPSTKERMDELELEKNEIEGRIASEEMKKPLLTKERIMYWLYSFKSGNIDDVEYKRRVIDTLVNSVYVYDEGDKGRRIVFTFNISGQNTATLSCSDIACFAPPNFRNPPRDRWVMGGISYYSKKRNEITHPLMGGIRMKAQIIAALLFLVLGIVFACGKGTFLIAGYNTLPEEKKARYDARRILKSMSRMMFSCVGCMAVGILGSIVDAPWLVVLGIVLTVLVIVFFLIRINRESKR